MSAGILIVLSNSVAGEEDAFNNWYYPGHIQEMMAMPTAVAARRYVIDEERARGTQPHRYMAMYEYSDMDIAAPVNLEWLKAGKLSVSPTMDMRSASMTFFISESPQPVLATTMDKLTLLLSVDKPDPARGRVFAAGPIQLRPPRLPYAAIGTDASVAPDGAVLYCFRACSPRVTLP